MYELSVYKESGKERAMINQSYDQPFFVGLNNPRFPTARNGYLPALEPKEEEVEVEKEEPWVSKQWDVINQLRGMVKFLYLKETERRANASKRKPKSKY